MSILIKGIEMPKSCDECIRKYSFGCKTHIGYHHKDTGRANKCPIVEVDETTLPKGHDTITQDIE